MGRKVIALWLSLAMLLSLVVIIIEIAPVVKAPTIIYVDDVSGEGPGNPAENYTKIQDAINASKDGDTVFVYSGTYYENVVVNKTINLTGEDMDTTIIDGNGIDDVVKITANFVNMTGFKVKNSAGNPSNAGIELNNVQHCSVIYNHATNNRLGIRLEYSNRNNITCNDLPLNSNVGIHIYHSSRNSIVDNSISYGIYGIFQQYGSYNNITGNKMIESGIVIEGHGIEYWNTHEIDTSNIVNGKPVYYWKNRMGGLIPQGAGQVILANCTDVRVEYQEIKSSTRGIVLGYSSYNNITANNISNNYYGIELTYSNSNNITENIVLDGLMSTSIFSDSFNNQVYHNVFGGLANDYSNNGNQWDNGYPSGGNYWYNYNGVDNYTGPKQNISGSDGIGDTPYVIDPDSQDNYPLMAPYKPLENYTILKQGWNLISIPLIQEEQNLTRMLGSIDGWYDAVQWYDNKDPNDQWKHHKIGKPFGNDLSEINETMGFWIHITPPGDTIFVYNGSQPTSNQTISLHPGWNLVGYPSLASYNRTEGLNNLTFGQDVDSIWTYNADTQKWIEIIDTGQFEVGKGYWIHSKVKKTWIVPL